MVVGRTDGLWRKDRYVGLCRCLQEDDFFCFLLASMRKPLLGGLRQTSVHCSLFFPACLKLTPEQFQLWVEVVSKKKGYKELCLWATKQQFFFFPLHFRDFSTTMAFLWKFFWFGWKIFTIHNRFWTDVFCDLLLWYTVHQLSANI